MWSRISGSTTASTGSTITISTSSARGPAATATTSSRRARRSNCCGRTSTASASSRDRSSSCSTSAAMRFVCCSSALLSSSCCAVSRRSPRWFSVWTKPCTVVTGVRSSCAASATKFVITSFARSSARRVSCSCSKRRTRSSAVAVSAATAPSTRSSSSPKNGAYGRRPRDDRRAGCSMRMPSPSPVVPYVASSSFPSP